MMKDELHRLRERIASAPVNGRGRRQYDKKLRQEITRYASNQHAHGESFSKIAQTLGLPSTTILNWRGKGQPTSKKQPVGFRPVAVRADEPTGPKEAASSTNDGTGPGGQAIVVVPGGVQIQGLSVGELAELVRTLQCLP